ncbi:MAG: signal peptidase II [Planctomycetota bacterium]|jgi:signal peptidase II
MDRRRRAAWLALAVGITAIDLWSKSLWKYPPHRGYPHEYLEPTNHEVIPGWLHIRAVWNEGGVWSLPIAPTILLIATLLAVPVLILWLLWPKQARAWDSAGKVLVLGGAVGNLYDRIAYGAVRDFVDVYLFGWDYPVFNVADTALVVGIVMLLVCSWRDRRKPGAAK